MLRTLTLALGFLALATLHVPVVSAQDAGSGEAGAPAAVQGAAEAEHDDHVSAAHEEPNILEPQLPLAFWTLVVFVILLLILWHFAWGPLTKALQNRELSMAETVQRAEQARADAERLLAEHRGLIDQANQHASAILDEARRDAEVHAEKVRKAAQQEAESTLDRARREIESARNQALVDIWGRTAELAVNVAGKVLDRELGQDDHRRLIEVAQGELPESPVHNNSAGAV